MKAIAKVKTGFDYSMLKPNARAIAQDAAGKIKGLVELTSEYILTIGKELQRAKSKLGHGQFGPWLAAEFGWSQDTAHNMMRAAEQYGQNPNGSVFEPSALYELSKRSTPDAARAEADLVAARGEVVTKAKAKEIIAKVRTVEAPPVKPVKAPAADRTPTRFDPGPRVIGDASEFAKGMGSLSSAPAAKPSPAKVAAASIVPAEQPPAARLPAWIARHTAFDIITGDCQVIMPRLKNLGVYRLVVMDPPYNQGIDYGQGAAADSLSDSVYLNWVAELIRRAWDVLAADGSMWIVISDEYAAEYVVAAKKLGFTLRSWIKWYETFGTNCEKKFNRTSRHILYFVKDAKRFVWNPEAVNCESARQRLGDPRANPAGKVWDDVWTGIPRLVGNAAERLPDFPTQLPLALIKPIIGCATDPGDSVLDPTCGSGTTGAAALMLGRKFQGIELCTDFVDAALERLSRVAREVRAK